jgi:hypothetical protein
MKMEQTECSEMLAYKIQTPGITQKKAYNIFEDIKKHCILLHSILCVFKDCHYKCRLFPQRNLNSVLCNVEDCVLCEVRMIFRVTIKWKSVFKGLVHHILPNMLFKFVRTNFRYPSFLLDVTVDDILEMCSISFGRRNDSSLFYLN